MGIQIFLGKPSASIEQWIKDHAGPIADPKTYIKFSDGTEFYDVIEFPDGLDGIFDLRTAAKYGWTDEGHTGYDGPPEWDNKHPVEVVFGSNVINIGDYAFYNCSDLTSVTMPDSVKGIWSQAFYQCTGLTSMTIPDGVTSIGGAAFSGCSSLASVTIPGSVKNIWDGAFYNCSALTSVTIPDGVTSIGPWAFSDCTNLTNVTIPDSVTSIGEGVFQNCGNLATAEFKGRALAQIKTIPDADGNIRYAWGLDESVIVPGIVEDVVLYTTAANPNTWLESTPYFNTDNNAFYGFNEKHNAVKVIIPSKVNDIDVTSIQQETFSGCSSLKSVAIPNGVTSIGYGVFEDCTNLTSVTIGNGVTSIDDYAFSGCSSLTHVTIPDSVTSIGYGAFYDCNDSLFDITTISGVKLVDGWAIGSTESLVGDLNLTGVRGIGPFAFENCTGLTSVTLPDGIPNIVRGAFFGCSGLASVTIPEGVTSIDDQAFSGCSSLTKVTIPGSVLNIWDHAFNNCSSLTSVTIPDSATSIGDSAFEGCTGLTSVEFKGRTLAQVRTIPDAYGDEQYSWGIKESVIVPGIVEDVVLYTTAENPNTWLEGTPEFDADAGTFNGFAEKANAVKVIIPSKVSNIDVTSIGIAAFNTCIKLTSVTIPSGVTNIEERAFKDCEYLTSMTIPSSVTNIEAQAFYWCSRLTSVEFEGNAPTVASNTFYNVAEGCKAVISPTATGFPEAGETWNWLIVEVKS